MDRPLMRKATALWLINNTCVTFRQIAEFCDLHIVEVEALANEIGSYIQELNPIANGQLTEEEIERCSKDQSARLKLHRYDLCAKERKNKKKYTPIVKRQERPEAILWILKNFPHVEIKQICDLLGTTKRTVQAIKDETYWNSANLSPNNPVLMGLCSQEELERVVGDKSESA
ncbi:cell cycle transcriptional regulator TrcR [Candidatus Hydrogenosomobacter endosymbioticus]|uniref:Cytoplasmic protein n=1 Tax=Candidatus Hydrogenosomobacter endosymbioticus TaxID=2558174 RepID=A0ABM7V8L3_9PROT|nr:cell cycle transcriptional regulator TrcR [Candidatus Hydrogenosomobacter endosymbioticus]BDB96128.1 hypothetical protein HYD_2610 [Candidatus Hydrogenosomobacter endosymbioticus]